MRRKHQFLAGLAAALLTLALPVICQAATITVNSLNDPTTTSGNGLCSLREAIDNANSPGTDTTGGDCTLGSGNDTIVFGTGLTGTITLVNNPPQINNNLTIQGPTTPTPGITISGNNEFQVLFVFVGATLNLSYLTIADGSGSDGGGIDNLGTLMVSNSTFSGNSAFTGSGIYNGGSLTLVNSTLSNNRPLFGLGGGIFNTPIGSATVINSTFTGNFTNQGGGIFNAGTLTVVNSTFADNQAPLGLGGNIYNASVANFKGTILSSSVAEITVRNSCAGVAITDEGYNLSDDDSCGFISVTSHVVTDAELDLESDQSPADNGGPTATIALGDTSIAINSIPVASCQYVNVNPCTNPPTTSASGPLVCDQRGEPRPSSGESACAIGAFEPQTLTVFAEFDTGLIVFPNQFAAGGSFTLAADAPTFNPPTQAVTLTISSAAFGPLAVTIPAGSFKLVKGQYKYSGTIGGVNYGVTISAPVDGAYEFTFAAFGVDVTGITNPLSVTLQIGSNIGTDDNVAAAIL